MIDKTIIANGPIAHMYKIGFNFILGFPLINMPIQDFTYRAPCPYK
jgi:hypothetical protein